ncbi:hypothetical protein Cme02nite_26150 [Catellatospora methionotrophica]|uniref:Uncharacterized protein n=1 Tax=Catellatospora methionotrophica TaxID=121620 RepID=A0A8J3PFE4_9ACTN|nr:hypothetical protein Cme02nite_26150 [Catellatospora methionotrophica]
MRFTELDPTIYEHRVTIDSTRKNRRAGAAIGGLFVFLVAACCGGAGGGALGLLRLFGATKLGEVERVAASARAACGVGLPTVGSVC